MSDPSPTSPTNQMSQAWAAKRAERPKGKRVAMIRICARQEPAEEQVGDGQLNATMGGIRSRVAAKR